MKPMVQVLISLVYFVGWHGCWANAQPISAPTDADHLGGTYFLGVAKVDISPQEPVLLSGYAGRPHELTQNVVQPLFARAMVIGEDASEAPEGRSPHLLVSVDNCAVHAAVRRLVVDEIQAQFGIPATQITIASTHTHSAPMLSGALSNLLIRDLTEAESVACNRYTQQLIKNLLEVTHQALVARQWVTLQWQQGELDFAINRRGGQAVDHSLPMLVAYDEQQQPALVLANYACHCVAAGSGLEICGDWAGFACAKLEQQLPGTVAMVVIGCGADQNPRTMGAIAAAQQQGEQLAAKLQEMLGKPQRPITGRLDSQFQEITLPLAELPSTDEWERRAQEPGIIGHHARKNLGRLQAGESLPREIQYPIQSWRFGNDLALVFLGGEVVVDYAHLLRRQLDRDRLWVTAYANDVACYIPSQRILREGGYEGGDAMVWYDLPARLTPATQDLIVAEVQRQLGTDYAAMHDQDRTGGTWPRSPQASLDLMVTHQELRVELVASEPLIRDPVAIDFGPDGRLWVAQMHDYPEGLDGSYQAGGSIQVLRDTDGDGQYDASHTFLDQLPFPTDVKVWRDGVLICTAPQVLFARDTDGDGTADEVQTILSGFETHNFQARVNSLTWGLDHWVYGAAGIFGGTVENSRGERIDLSNRDFRLRPDTGEVMSASGRTQQGRVRDDWGNWFGCDNSTLLVHYPAADHYSHRQPTAPTPPTSVGVALANHLFPPPNTVQWALSGPPGRPTSACGLGILRSDWLGKEYYGNSFTCEPVNQLVHRLQLTSHGVTFQGRRAANESDREFLWSTDPWFRPVQVKTGLDGALYVVDMYRYLIEHPRFLSEQVRAQIDVRAGHDRGRIYRIVPRDTAVSRVPAAEDLTRLGPAELARRFDTSNGALRDLIHQMLWWSQDRQVPAPGTSAAVPVLQDLVTSSLHPAVRGQALSLLAEWNELPVEHWGVAVQDADPRVRRTAVRVAEAWLRDPMLSERVGTLVTPLVNDPDPQVRLQVAYSLGEWPDERAALALGQLLDKDASDPWIAAAVQTSLHAQNIALVVQQRLARLTEATVLPALERQLVRQTLRMADVDGWEIVSRFLEPSTETPAPAWQWSLWFEVTDHAASEPRLFHRLDYRQAMEAMIQQVLSRLQAGDLDRDRQLQGLELLGHASNPSAVLPTLRQTLRPQTPLDLQMAALRGWVRLARPNADGVSAVFCEDLTEWTPQVQEQALQMAKANPQLTLALVTALANQKIPADLFDAISREFFLEHPQESIRELAQQVFAVARSGQWTEKFPQYLNLDLANANASAGRQVFRQHCAACHRMDEYGHEVGPDLRALTDRSVSGLLASILEPHESMDARYAAYIVLTLDGQVISGLLQSESTNSVTLLGQEGRQHQLLRREIEELRRTGKSLMPEGLEKEIPPAAMRDLLKYLGAGSVPVTYRYLDAAGPHATYPDSQPPQKLVDGRLGTDRFNDGQWLNFYHPGHRVHGVVFEFAQPIVLSHIRITYGVNHRPGGIHAPQVMRGNLSDASGTVVARIEISDWDDTPDGLGVYQIAKRQQEIPFAAVEVAKVELEWESDAEWTSLAEIEFDPNPDVVGETAAPEAAMTEEAVGGTPADEQPATGFAAVDRILALVATTRPGTADEYRVIPEIWREAIAAGQRNDADELRQILQVSLPQGTQPLYDWQAVVVGGGVVNGISQLGIYPGPRIDELLAADDSLRERWVRSLALAAEMVDHEPTPQGTRYDALRMIALQPWDLAREPLRRYLLPGTPPELQMGAVSGLVDVPHGEAAISLHGALGHLPADLRTLAVAGLARPQAILGLRAALESGQISRESLDPEVRRGLERD